VKRLVTAEIPIPAVVLGLPLEKSENPMIASIVDYVPVEVEIRECENRSISIVSSADNDILRRTRNFIDNLLANFELNLCINIIIPEDIRTSPSGLYASLTAHIFKRIASYYGEKTPSYQIIEYCRLLEPLSLPLEWQQVLDTLRYAAIEGGTVIYRNDEEYAKLSEATLQGLFSYEGSRFSGGQKLNVDDLGSDLYGAFIHTVGVLTLEGAVRFRDEKNVSKVLHPLLRVHNYITSLFWGEESVAKDVLFSPGLNGVFELFRVKDGFEVRLDREV
jgi:hypothetical protein